MTAEFPVSKETPKMAAHQPRLGTRFSWYESSEGRLIITRREPHSKEAKSKEAEAQRVNTSEAETSEIDTIEADSKDVEMAPPPNGQIPPPLPPSVEEAYRRKCIQLKQRLLEIEDANDASRLRLERQKRGIDKLRLERAYLLEQLAKRTSTNVEDSEGSPSPPPTPKEKPLRTKRGHRKPEFLTNLDSSRSVFQQAQALTLSPTNSDAFSATAPSRAGRPPVSNFVTAATGTNGLLISAPPKKARNAFEMFVNDNRSVLTVAHRQEIKAGTFDVDRELAILWQNLPQKDQEPYRKHFQNEDPDTKDGSHEEEKDEAKDEDTEMGEQAEDDNDV